MASGRQAYIETLLKQWGFSESDVLVLSDKIYSIGEQIGFVGDNYSKDEEKNRKRAHKYDTWIAKEVRRDVAILDRIDDIRQVIDWVVATKANIFNYNFIEAFKEQRLWHEKLAKNTDYNYIKIPVIDNSRIVFAFSDEYHFLYLLTPDELKYEGKKMGHCVGGAIYKQAIKNGHSLILSLRDMGNMPHVTIEINARSMSVAQQRGKGNEAPEQKYLDMLEEFVLYASDYPGLENKETLDFLNLSKHFKKS